MPGCEVALADDGEVICRGGNVFPGYLDDPEKTAEALDADGWLHTGDIGEIDDDGYLRIVDRKKELIITAGGKNISPANLEAALKTIPLVGQACAIGDKRPFVSALVVLDPEVAPAWAKQQGIEFDVARRAGRAPRGASPRSSAGLDEVMAAFNSAERVKKVEGARRGVAARLRGADARPRSSSAAGSTPSTRPRSRRSTPERASDTERGTAGTRKRDPTWRSRSLAPSAYQSPG